MNDAPVAIAPLPQSFYARPALVVARALLGTKLVRRYRGERLSGVISEVEAYLGERDSASHAFRGPTPRNRVMFGPAGQAYIYFIYGMHYCLNVVTGEDGFASAVLIRGLQPLEGVETMQRLRHRRAPLADGPGKLCQALAIDARFYGWDLTRGDELWIEPHVPVPRSRIGHSPRVGIAYAQPEHRAAHWRLFIKPSRR